MLTSRAREILRGISHVIIDEIHAVCGNKRGAFLALLLERLQGDRRQAVYPDRAVGDPAPLDEVARYLGGLEWTRPNLSSARRAVPRPVTIVDAGWRRDLDLQVIWPRKLDRAGVSGSIWPEIESELLSLVRRTPLDDHLRQQSADGREADGSAQRACRGRAIARTPDPPRDATDPVQTGYPSRARSVPTTEASASTNGEPPKRPSSKAS